MIKSFKNKQLENFWVLGKVSGIRGDLRELVKSRLAAVDSIKSPNELAVPPFNGHQLTGNRKGTYSVKVKRNWRITYKFKNGDAYNVDLEDYH